MHMVKVSGGSLLVLLLRLVCYLCFRSSWCRHLYRSILSPSTHYTEDMFLCRQPQCTALLRASTFTTWKRGEAPPLFNNDVFIFKSILY